MQRVTLSSRRRAAGPTARAPRRAEARRESVRREDGTAAVEFALIMPLLFMMFFGLVQYGLYFYAMQVGSQTADATARQLSVGNCQDVTALDGFVQSRLGTAATGTATVTTTYTTVDGAAGTATSAAGGTVTVLINFPTINMHLPLIPMLGNAVVSRSVTARVEDTTDQGCGS